MCSKFLFILLLFLNFSAQAFAVESAEDKFSEIEKFITKTERQYRNKIKIGTAFYNADTGDEIFSYKGNELFTPASVAKLFTTHAALKYLGGNYRFPTEVFVEHLPFSGDKDEKSGLPLSNGNVGKLYVRGYGDPSLVEEELFQLAKQIKAKGVKKINGLVCDDTLFVDAPGATGPRPYEAALGALSLNHNSYALTVTPTKINNRVFATLTEGSGFSLVNRAMTSTGSKQGLHLVQIPSSDGALEKLHNNQLDSRSFNAPSVRITLKGTLGGKAGSVTTYYSVPYPTVYFASVFRSLLEQVGIEVNGSINFGLVPQTAKLFTTHESKDLSFIIRDLNYYSNNFVAGQLSYALGQDSAGYFRQDIGLSRIIAAATDVGIATKGMYLADASGLDKDNKISPNQLASLLSASFRDFTIAPDFIASLSRYGKTGTLKKRFLDGNEDSLTDYGVWAKTGTLTNVSSLAGYFQSKKLEHIAFAIVINGAVSSGKAKNIEDDILKISYELGVKNR